MYLDKYKIVDEFNNSYWNGKSSSLFINGFFIDDITQFNYQLIENTSPVYSWDKFTPSFSKGVRMIQGEFAINYKQDMFIFALLEKIRGFKTGNSTAPKAAVETELLLPELDLITDPKEKQSARLKQAKIMQEKRYYKSNHLSTIMEEENSYSYVANSYKPALYANLTMTIQAGYRAGEGVLLRMSNDGRYTEAYHSSENPLYNIGTGCTLINCRLTSRSLRVSDQGVPNLEVYSFVAADLQPINSLRQIEKFDSKTTAASVTKILEI